MASEIRVNKINSSSGVGTITLSPTGVDISGVTTVSTLRSNIGIFSGTVTGEHHGDGSNLTGVASTENIRTNTNATFLQNVSVVGTSTVTGNIVPSSDSATDIGTNSVRFQNAYVDTYHGSAASLTSIPAANIVGVATAGFERTGGFSDYVKIATSTWTSDVASVAIDSLDTTTYKYFIMLWNSVPAEDNTNLRFIWRLDGSDATGASYDWALGTNYGYSTTASVQNENYAKVCFATVSYTHLRAHET